MHSLSKRSSRSGGEYTGEKNISAIESEREAKVQF